jgi:hypothetical protein
MGGGLDTFIKCFTEYDPVWIDIAWWTILRNGQMESLRMIDDDEWPDITVLQDYSAKYPGDPNFYYPNDLVIELGIWLRDHTVKKRKERVTARKEQERAQRNQQRKQ